MKSAITTASPVMTCPTGSVGKAIIWVPLSNAVASRYTEAPAITTAAIRTSQSLTGWFGSANTSTAAINGASRRKSSMSTKDPLT